MYRQALVPAASPPGPRRRWDPLLAWVYGDLKNGSGGGRVRRGFPGWHAAHAIESTVHTVSRTQYNHLGHTRLLRSRHSPYLRNSVPYGVPYLPLAPMNTLALAPASFEPTSIHHEPLNVNIILFSFCRLLPTELYFLPTYETPNLPRD